MNDEQIQELLSGADVMISSLRRRVEELEAELNQRASPGIVSGLRAQIRSLQARVEALEGAAERLLSLVEAKGEPRTSEANQRLLEAGDTIAVSEGNLWTLLAVLRSGTA